jgi:hypothetical protein
MNETLRKLQIVTRSQLMLGRAHAREWTRAALLMSIALVFFIAAMAVLDLSAFLFLSGRFGTIQAGVIVGGTNLAIGGVLLRLASSPPKQTEEMKLAQELSEVSLDALSKDMDAARDELRAFSRDVRRIRSAVHLVTSVLGTPLSLLVRVISEGLSESDPAESEEDEGPGEEG